MLVPSLALSVLVGLSHGLPARGASTGGSRVLPAGRPIQDFAAGPMGSATAREAELRSSRLRARPRVRGITLQVDPRREGLGAYSQTWGDSLVFDKNRDGNPDVLLSFHTRPWEIWLGNSRGGFTFDRYLSRTDRHQCATADFAGPDDARPDGRPDLYCVRGANNGTVSDKRNELLIQQPRGGFENVVSSWGARDPSGRGRAVSILDIRGNGRPSLFVGNLAPASHPSRDHIFVNRGKRFVERRTGGLPSVQNTRCSSTGDFDRDGRQDFLSCSYSLRLYENRTTRAGRVSYREVARDEVIPARRWQDAGLVHLNRDRWPDLVTVSNLALEVRLNRRQSPHFPQVDFSFPLSAGFSFCSGRANGDTATDLLVVQKLVSPDDRTQQRDWMLVNAGRGQRFRALPVPQPAMRRGRNGNGDTCSAIPGYRGNRAAWTISNGRSIPSPEEQRYRGYRQLVILTR
ncbi:FG-GAP repeat domain-containing protein [Nocardioides euryhalodurans]|uniref:FG-GAP repeat domain-containing protein n=1 Tax=Nocardioides euryhalodurans TaxID=2518370 RepID=UPI00141E932E|nr:VCBS repeat-containing protein [Nocardioides euryhalodurans]